MAGKAQLSQVVCQRQNWDGDSQWGQRPSPRLVSKKSTADAHDLARFCRWRFRICRAGRKQSVCVASGNDGWTRNPMLLATLALLLSVGLWYRSVWFLLLVAISVSPGWIFSVRMYEERELEIRFGRAYRGYRARTPFLPARADPTKTTGGACLDAGEGRPLPKSARAIPPPPERHYSSVTLPSEMPPAGCALAGGYFDRRNVSSWPSPGASSRISSPR